MAGPQFSTSHPRTPPKPRRPFTVAEANRTLPLVSRVVRDIVNTHERASDLQGRLEDAPSVKQAMVLQEELEAVLDLLKDYELELRRIGCDLKDYQTGLIDFVGRHQGREVCLCWRLGEPKVGYWHELQAGFAGRQPVSLLDEAN